MRVKFCDIVELLRLVHEPFFYDKYVSGSDKRARRTASTTSVHHASTFNTFLVYYIRKEMLDHLCWNLNYLNERRKS